MSDEITISCDLDVALSLTNSKTLKGDLLKAKVQAQIWYLEELISKHFERPNPNSEYKYRPNKDTYEVWKKKHYGSLPQLVLKGGLRNAVLKGKVDTKTGKILFNLPDYGLYQLQAGRDFLSPSWYDTIEIQDRLRRNLFFIRSQRAKQFARKQ